MLSSGTVVENEWVATSPLEFSQKIEKVLALPVVKSLVVSIFARASQQDK